MADADEGVKPANGKPETKLLDELEKGPWPSFVTEIKSACGASGSAKDLLGQLELSYEEQGSHWKHGGLVGVLGYGGGVIGRYSDVGEQFPKVAHFHTLRVNQPAGWFYTSEALRSICDIWERHGSGLTNMHGSTGDMILLGTTTRSTRATFQELTQAGFDLGGSGSAVRTPSCCVGMARCEWACFDAMKLCYDLTMAYQDEMHRRRFPTSSRSSARRVPTIAWRRLLAPIFPSSAPGRTTFRSTRPRWRTMPLPEWTSKKTSATTVPPSAWSGTARNSDQQP